MKLSTKLTKTKFENNRVVVRLQASEWERARERENDLSALKQARAMFPSIDFSIIQLDEKKKASYAEGDEITPRL
ncbi:hypothetical protein U1Q18_049458, partial [Sarracenia purpurea var. burkii]